MLLNEIKQFAEQLAKLQSEMQPYLEEYARRVIALEQRANAIEQRVEAIEQKNEVAG